MCDIYSLGAMAVHTQTVMKTIYTTLVHICQTPVIKVYIPLRKRTGGLPQA